MVMKRNGSCTRQCYVNHRLEVPTELQTEEDRQGGTKDVRPEQDKYIEDVVFQGRALTGTEVAEEVYERINRNNPNAKSYTRKEIVKKYSYRLGKGGTSGGERARLVENDLDASHNSTVRFHKVWTSPEGRREILGFADPIMVEYCKRSNVSSSCCH